MIEEINGHKIERREHAPHVVRTGWKEGNNRIGLVVHFGLHYLRGNRLPHFSITATGYENGRDTFGGCCHEIIAERLPALADVIALHLSDMDGSPMHTDANGWYWFAGALGGLTERYHGGNSKGHHGGEYRNPTPDECLEIFARHVRITPALADELRRSFERDLSPSGYSAREIDSARARFRAWIDAQRPRWKSEADALIEAYGFKPYGDAWTAAA